MQAGAFLRRNGAHGLGHVGWSFEYPDGTYSDGGVENRGGMPVSAPYHTDFWRERTPDFVSPMRLLDYDSFKMIDVGPSDPSKADETVAWIKDQPYLLLMRNCMDSTYDVLRSYGVQGLPFPFLEITPNNWFDDLPGVPQPVSGVNLLQAGMIQPRPSLDIDSKVGLAVAMAPAWRTPGTTEWQVFHEQLFRSTMAAKLQPK